MPGRAPGPQELRPLLCSSAGPGERLPTRQMTNTPQGTGALGAAVEDGRPRGDRAAHLQVSPATKSKMAPTSSLFQKSLKYRSATFVSPSSSGS